MKFDFFFLSNVDKKKKGDESSQQSGKGEGNSRSSNDGKKSYVRNINDY